MLGGADTMSDARGVLPPAEGTLLWSIRAWVLARVRSEDLRIEERVAGALDALDATEAGAGLLGFLDAVERGGTRAVVVEKMCARDLTPDERALLRIFALVGAGREPEAMRSLLDMVGPAAVGPALDRAAEVARALAEAGHALAPPSPSLAGVTLH